MKHSYKLSTSNIIFAVIVILITITTSLIGWNTQTNLEYAIGHVIGRIIGALLFPFAVSLLFWFVLGRKENGGTTVFNIVLALVLLGQLSKLINSAL